VIIAKAFNTHKHKSNNDIEFPKNQNEYSVSANATEQSRAVPKPEAKGNRPQAPFMAGAKASRIVVVGYGGRREVQGKKFSLVRGMHGVQLTTSSAASNRYQALPFFRFFQLPLSFPGISAPFILSNKDDEDFEIGFDASLRFAAPLMLNPPTGTSSWSIMSCLSIGSAGCL